MTDHLPSTQTKRKRSSELVTSSSTKPSDRSRPLPNRIGRFVDYDLSTIKNTKAGFLLEDQIDNPNLIKRHRLIQELKDQRLKQSKAFKLTPILSLDPTKNPKCKVCGSIELDLQLFQAFHISVCTKCKNDHPDRFSLLTKTECKQDYLLTDPELKDSELLPHLLKANPHQSTYSNMMLFLREQVEAYAFSDQKWGSPEALDQEFERREALKKKIKNQKFENQLKDLRRKTRSNVWHRRQEAVHHHTFTLVVQPTNDSTRSKSSSSKGHRQQSVQPQLQRCTGCGLEIECETF